ncbi:hypothetical protein JCM1841_002692 [Sporobolomyces salmonicolor]
MSAASSLTDVFPKGFVLTGGIPIRSRDLAASVVFVIAYFVLVPLAIWRVLNPASRTCFSSSNGHYSTGLFVAEQILLLCGFLLICEPLVSLVKYHAFQGWVPTGQKGNAPFEWLLRIMKLALLVAIILGIAAGSEISGAENNPSQAAKLKHCRWANTVIALAIVVLAVLLVLSTHLKETRPFRSTAYLVVVGAVLIVPSAEKLALYASPPSSVSAGSKAAFYCLSSLSEYLITLLYLGVNLEAEFDIREGAREEKWDKQARKGEALGLSASEKETQGAGLSESR